MAASLYARQSREVNEVIDENLHGSLSVYGSLTAVIKNRSELKKYKAKMIDAFTAREKHSYFNDGLNLLVIKGDDAEHELESLYKQLKELHTVNNG